MIDACDGACLVAVVALYSEVLILCAMLNGLLRRKLNAWLGTRRGSEAGKEKA